jgi:hypothetical protein
MNNVSSFTSSKIYPNLHGRLHFFAEKIGLFTHGSLQGLISVLEPSTSRPSRE